MARVIPGPLLAELQGSPLAGECLVLQTRDGFRVGFTTFDEPQVVDLGAAGGSVGEEICDEGMILSALTLSTGTDASFAQVQGPLGPVLTRAAVDGGRWTGALAWLVRVSPGEDGFAPLLHGTVGEARCEGNRFALEIRNQGDELNQTLGRQITAYCPLRFGSTECGAVPVELVTTVAAVTDAMRFTLTSAGGHPDDFFNLGEVEFNSGALAGVVSENLFDFAASGAAMLWAPLSAAPEVGDAVIVRQGCPKTRDACVTLQGGDAAPFRGFPDVPGSDLVLRPANPGGG